ncbi:MAG: hypothetical protein WC683_02955 [bacterium]
MSTTTAAPMVTCPVCGHEFQQDDYYEMRAGSELECRKCGAQLAVVETETVTYWSICTKAEYDAAEAKAEAQRERQRKRFLEMDAERKKEANS